MISSNDENEEHTRILNKIVWPSQQVYTILVESTSESKIGNCYTSVIVGSDWFFKGFQMERLRGKACPCFRIEGRGGRGGLNQIYFQVKHRTFR